MMRPNVYDQINRQLDQIIAEVRRSNAVRCHDAGSLQRVVPAEPVLPSMLDHAFFYLQRRWFAVKYYVRRINWWGVVGLLGIALSGCTGIYLLARVVRLFY